MKYALLLVILLSFEHVMFICSYLMSLFVSQLTLSFILQVLWHSLRQISWRSSWIKSSWQQRIYPVYLLDSSFGYAIQFSFFKFIFLIFMQRTTDTWQSVSVVCKSLSIKIGSHERDNVEDELVMCKWLCVAYKNTACWTEIWKK